jgi:hypothetical protein
MRWVIRKCFVDGPSHWRAIYYFVFCTACILILASCRKQGYPIYHKELVQVDSLVLPLPVNAGPYTITYKILSTDEHECLYWKNRFNNSILVYNLDRGELDRIFSFPKDGPGSVSDIDGITVFSKDSIYLRCESLFGKLVLIDSFGRIRNYLQFSDTTLSASNYLEMNAKFNNDIYRTEGKQMILPLDFPTPFGQYNYPGYPIWAIMDLKQGGTLRKSPARLPEELFVEGGVLPYYRSSCFDGHRLIYQFLSDDHLYILNDIMEEPLRIKIPSKYAAKNHPMESYDHPYDCTVRSQFYTNLHYDIYRKLFYRVVKHAMTSWQDLDEEYYFPSQFSIMVMDHELNLLAEIPFIDTPMSMVNIFVGKKGLYISKFNPRFQDIDEDKLEFAIYQFM